MNSAPGPLLVDLTAQARAAAHARSSVCPCGAATLADRPDGLVVRHADTVAKAHAPGTDPAELAGRLTLANAKAYADTGVDYLAVGALTHSSPILDIGLDLRAAE